MERLTAILPDSACKYAVEGGAARLKLAREGERLCLSVFNMGERVPPEKPDHVFERCYREDEARGEGGYGRWASPSRGASQRSTAAGPPRRAVKREPRSR